MITRIVRVVLHLQLQPMRVILYIIIIHCSREVNNFVEDGVNDYSIETCWLAKEL